jgi:ABC-2 type transport system permease protein
MTIAATTTLAPAHGRLRPSSIVAAEWIKLRTVRSTMWTVVAITVVTLGIAAIVGVAVTKNWPTMSIGDKLSFDPTRTVLHGLMFSQLIIGVLGVLVMSAEYGTGTIAATLSAVPSRPKVLAAKALVFGALAALLGQVLAFGGFFVGQALLQSPAPHATLSEPGVLRAVVGGGLVIPVVGLLALGIATIIRHSAGAITTYVGVLLVAPLITSALPASIGQPVLRYMPLRLSDTMINPVTGDPSAFSPWVGFAILGAYAVAALLLGGWLMARRDS